MESETPNGSPEPMIPLGREIYITPEAIALRAIVDAIDQRVQQKFKKEEEWDQSQESTTGK